MGFARHPSGGPGLTYLFTSRITQEPKTWVFIIVALLQAKEFAQREAANSEIMKPDLNLGRLSRKQALFNSIRCCDIVGA